MRSNLLSCSLAALAACAALAAFAPAAHAQIGNAVVAPLPNPQRGRTWDDTANNTLPPNWLIQTPPANLWNVPYAPATHEPVSCVPNAPGCDTEFARVACTMGGGQCGVGRACAALQASSTTLAGAGRLMCVGPEDGPLLDTIWDIVAHTTSLVDIVSLHSPQGDYLAAIHNGIRAIDAANPGPGAPITVRVFYADYLQGGVTQPDKLITALSANLSVNTRVRIHVAASAYSKSSWNHAKIIVRDGVDALVGGHNFYPTHYLLTHPVTDVSIRVRGGAAQTSQQFADTLWTWACGNLSEDKALWVWGAWVKAFDGTNIVGAKPSARAPACPNNGAGGGLAVNPLPPGGGNVRVIGVGRLGEADNPNQQADDALLAMIDNATTSLKIAQQNVNWGPLGATGPWGDLVIEHLARAVLRGVAVKIVVSNWGHYKSVFGSENLAGVNVTDYPADRPADIVAAIRKSIVVLGKDPNAPAWRLPMPPGIVQVIPGVGNLGWRPPTAKEVELLLADRVRVTALRKSALWDLYPTSTWGMPALHSKLVVADDQIFYVGSQNLYACNLSEFGLIVDNAPATQTLLQQLWDPMWQASYHAAEPL